MKESASEAHIPQLPSNFQGHRQLRDSDSFNLFYKNILTDNNLADFETSLFSFMYNILGQCTCLFYRNINQHHDKIDLALQRGSYSTALSTTQLHSTFPNSFLLEIKSEAERQPNGVWETRPSELHWIHSFFSLYDEEDRWGLYPHFYKHTQYVRCGMLLRSASDLFGLLVYEHPLYHPYLDSPLRLEQFEGFLALALTHRQTVNYATQDQLTNLHRKYYFLNLAKRQLYGEHSHKNYQLLILDIDYFKNFNDSYGHLEGDRCLRAIGLAIKRAVRTRDFTGRFGGEEFICLIQSGLTQGRIVAQRICESIARIRLENSEGKAIPTPTISIGITSFRQGEALEQLIERADKALYQAKQNGRNQTVVSLR